LLVEIKDCIQDTARYVQKNVKKKTYFDRLMLCNIVECYGAFSFTSGTVT